LVVVVMVVVIMTETYMMSVDFYLKDDMKLEPAQAQSQYTTLCGWWWWSS